MPEKPSYEELEKRVGSLEAENAGLKEKWEDCRRLLEDLDEVIYKTDRQGRITYISPNIERLSGYPPEELLGRPFTDFVHPDERAGHLESLEKVLSGREFTTEHLYLTKDKGYTWALVSHKPLAEAGEIKGSQGIMVNIAARRKSEEELRRKAEEQALLLDSIPVQLWYLKDIETYGAVNRAHSEFIGLSGKDLENRRLDEFFSPEEAEVCREGNVEVFKTRKPVYTEELLKDKNGNSRLIAINKTPKLNSSGEVEYVVCSGYDITEQKNAEAMRSAYERLLNATVNAVDSLLMVVDRDYRIVFSNWKTREWIPEEERHKMPCCYRVLKNYDEPCRNCRAMKTFEDGRHRWYEDLDPIDGGFKEISLSPVFGDQGRIEYVLENVRDVTERKSWEERLRRSEERLALALENTNTGLWDWNVQTGEAVFNENWAEIAGFTLEELRPVSIQTWIDLCHPEDLERSNRELERHFSGDTGFYEFEARIRHKKGSWIWVLDRGRVVEWDGSGKPLRMIGTHTEISRLKHAEEEELRLNARIHQVQKGKEQALARMAGAVAHHFNNQLSVVMGNLELAMETLPSDSGELKNLEEAIGACRHASSISSELLAYLGQSRGKEKKIDLSVLCRSYLPSLKSIISGGLCLDSDLAEPGPVVQASESGLKKVIAGLLMNAWESIGDSYGRIMIRTRIADSSYLAGQNLYPEDWEPSGDRYACLEVSDTGCGISREDMEKMFDPFFSTKFTGRGLGLAVILGMVRADGGAIGVDSEAGKGTRVNVFLPLDTEECREPEEKQDKEKSRGNGCTVLLVEDRQEVRQMLRDLLRHLGFTTIEAAGGSEALEKLGGAAEMIDCVITDLSMPGMDGLETMAAVREISPDLPVILASGYDERQVMDESRGGSPAAFIQKPYQLSELKSVLARVLK